MLGFGTLIVMIRNGCILNLIVQIIFFSLTFQIATDEKEAILGSIPIDLRENGSVLYASLIDGKVI